jgi:hypothetical protein
MTLTDENLSRITRRLQTHPEFLAAAFARYQQLHPAIDLAAYLGLAPDDLHRLGMRLLPRPEHFDADVREIAAAFGVDVGKLAGIIRETEGA